MVETIRTVRFVFPEGRNLLVERKFIEVSTYVKNLVLNLTSTGGTDSDSDSDIDCDNTIEIPITNISYQTMEQVILWCKHYYGAHKDEFDSAHYKNAIDNEQSGSTTGDAKSGGSNGVKLNSPIGAWPDNEMDDFQTKMSEGVTDFWEREFLDVDADKLKAIILAANFLNIKPLLDSAAAIIAETFRGHSPKEILNAFNAARTAERAASAGQ